MYTEARFGRELEKELTKKFDISYLSTWAFNIYIKKTSQLESGLDEVIMNSVTMAEGPEFEYT